MQTVLCRNCAAYESDWAAELDVEDWGECKVVYRHYATLYFIFIVDQQESDLGILDLIQVLATAFNACHSALRPFPFAPVRTSSSRRGQVFVEALDKCFENVCELDIIFHSDKVNFVLDEICAAGMVLETNVVQILQAVHEQNKLHKKSEAVEINVQALTGQSKVGQRSF